LEGAAQTGVSIMQLVKTMDAGPVFGQKTIPLSRSEDKQTLAETLLRAGKDLLLELLPEIIDGTVMAKPQDETKASYDSLLTKTEGIIDWQKPATQLEKEVRAFLNWPKSRTQLIGKDVIITKAHVTPYHALPGEQIVDNKQLLVGTSHDALVIDRLKPTGKQEMSIEAFLAGYGKSTRN
jgi:methionyl-tRNA formyltransferase